MNRTVGLSLILLAAVLAPGAAHTQQAACTYDECALRVRSATLLRPPMLVRGLVEQEIAPLTPFGGPIAQHLQRSDSAYAYALLYDRQQPVAGVLNIVGPAVLILSPFLTNWRERPVASFALMAGGLGMSIYGGVLGNDAMDALSRAILLYNRELAR